MMGPLEPGAHAPQDVKAGARQLDPALEIQDVEGRAQVPVGDRLEVKGVGFALHAHDHVCAVVGADRHAGMG